MLLHSVKELAIEALWAFRGLNGTSIWPWPCSPLNAWYVFSKCDPENSSRLFTDRPNCKFHNSQFTILKSMKICTLPLAKRVRAMASTWEVMGSNRPMGGFQIYFFHAPDSPSVVALSRRWWVPVSSRRWWVPDCEPLQACYSWCVLRVPGQSLM